MSEKAKPLADSCTSGCVDEITWQDLGLEEVFRKIDHTGSLVGRETLYRWLRLETDVLPESRARLIDAFSGESAKSDRAGLQKILGEIGILEGAALSEALEKITVVSGIGAWIHVLLLVLYIPVFGLLFLNAGIGIWLFFALLLLSLITYFADKPRLQIHLRTLAFLLRLIRGGKSLLQALDKMIAKCEGARSPGNGETFVPQGEMTRLRQELWEALDGLTDIHVGSWLAFSMDKPIGNSNPLSIVLDYLHMILHGDLLIFYRMQKAVAGHISQLQDLGRVVGELDAALSVAAFREEMAYWCRPEWSKDCELESCALYHPLIKHPVPWDVSMQGGLLVTGSNATGKSTFLRGIGLAAILAQSIFTVPAKKYRAGQFRIFSSMMLQDHLERGESYFMAEIRSLKRICEAAGLSDAQEVDSESETPLAKKQALPVLCILDEVLRGTNTTDRVAGATEILRALAQAGALVVAATHDREVVVNLLKSDRQSQAVGEPGQTKEKPEKTKEKPEKALFSAVFFQEQLQDGCMTFDYRLHEGISGSSNALALLGLMGFPEAVVARAENLAEKAQNS